MKPVKITTATTSDVNPVVNAIVRAFSADPVARWVYRDPQHYRYNFPSFVRVFTAAAIGRGSADCVDDYSGVAIWLPPGVHADEKALFTLLQDSILQRDQAEVFAFFERMEKNHPAEPHWYLPMIGVEPAKHGRGYGSALLKHALVRCDGDRRLAYLEASSPRSMRLYERHGFESLGTIQVASSPPLYPMLRRPRRSAPWDKGNLFPSEKLTIRADTELTFKRPVFGSACAIAHSEKSIVN